MSAIGRNRTLAVDLGLARSPAERALVEVGKVANAMLQEVERRHPSLAIIADPLRPAGAILKRALQLNPAKLNPPHESPALCRSGLWTNLDCFIKSNFAKRVLSSVHIFHAVMPDQMPV